MREAPVIVAVRRARSNGGGGEGAGGGEMAGRKNYPWTGMRAQRSSHPWQREDHRARRRRGLRIRNALRTAERGMLSARAVAAAAAADVSRRVSSTVPSLAPVYPRVRASPSLLATAAAHEIIPRRAALVLIA